MELAIVSLIFFVTGMFLGFTLTVYSLSSILKKTSIDKQDTLLKKTAEEHEMIGSIKYRFKQIANIQEEQLSIISKIEGPSKGAAYSRGRNNISKYVEELEKTKIDIFRSILEDGFDPIVTIYDYDGNQRSIKMSEAVSIADKELENTKPTKKPTNNIKKTDSNIPGEIIPFKPRSNNENGNPKTD